MDCLKSSAKICLHATCVHSSKERPWPFHFSISRMVEPKNGRIFGWHKETCEHTRFMNILQLPKFKISSDKLFLGSTLTKHFFGPRNCCFFSLSRFFLVEKKSYGIKSIGVGMAGPPVLGFVKKVVDDKRWVVILFFSSNSAFGGMCFFCWWISDPFFFHHKSWWNSNKAQVVGRNLANESIDKHPTSRGVSCFKSSLLVQGSCWQYQNRNITLTELRHYISRLLGKWCSSSIEGIYFSFQRGYVQCLEQVNQTYSPNADWIAW